MGDASTQTSSNSRSSEVRNWVDVGFKTILSIVAAGTAYVFSSQNQENNDVKIVSELIMSNDDNKKKLGAALANAYYQDNRIPESLYLAIYQYVNLRSEPELRDIVNLEVQKFARDSVRFSDKSGAVNSRFPIYIYTHVHEDDQKSIDLSKKLQKNINAWVSPFEGSLIAKPFEARSKTSNKNVLKCFTSIYCSKYAYDLKYYFASKHNLELLVETDFQYGAEEKLNRRPAHFEIWLAKSK